MLASRLRVALDRCYLAGGIIAAGFLIAILAVIVLQMAARWTGHVFPGSTDYAGYCMAASSFFAFAYALSRGSHIRVSLLLTRLGRFERWGETWCFAIGTALAGYFAFYAIRAVYWSYKLNDISQGQDATPVWIPQLAMAAGTVLLAVAMVDNLIRLLFRGEHGIRPETVDHDGGE